MVMTYDPKIFEIVYRTEGSWPIRRALETFEYYRIHVRPEVYGGVAGLIFDQGETWSHMRKNVQPVMMKPKAVKSYVPVTDQVTREFMAKVGTMLDENSELPAKFNHEMALWAIESIGVIALDTRLGMLKETRNDEADRVIKVHSVIGFIDVLIYSSYLFRPSEIFWFFPTNSSQNPRYGATIKQRHLNN